MKQFKMNNEENKKSKKIKELILKYLRMKVVKTIDKEILFKLRVNKE